MSFEVESKLSVGTILECESSHSQRFIYGISDPESVDEFLGKEFKVSIVNWQSPEREVINIKVKAGERQYFHMVTLRDDYLYSQRFRDNPFGTDFSIKKISVNGQPKYIFSSTDNFGSEVVVRHGECSIVQ